MESEYIAEYIDVKDSIFPIFESEWADSQLRWGDFVKSKDLGVEYIAGTSFYANESYKVVDAKKWVYTRLKYGI